MENVEWLGGTAVSRRRGDGGNLVSSWKAWGRVRYGNLGNAYAAMESELGSIGTITNISRWERGVRRVPPVVINYMLSDVLPALLAESTDVEFIYTRLRLPLEDQQDGD